MSSSFKRDLKKIHEERHKGRTQPINVKHSKDTTSSLDKFLPETQIHCADCGQAVPKEKVRWLMKDDQKIPYCRNCFMTRAGKTVHTRD